MTTKRRLYIYLLDRFIPSDLSIGELMELVEEDPIAPFNMVKAVVEDEIGHIQDVRLYGRYFDPSEMDVVIEYLIKGGFGEALVKLIYSEDPRRALLKYYAREGQDSSLNP